MFTHHSPNRSYFSDGLLKGIKRTYIEGSALVRLIYINIATFLAIKLSCALIGLLGVNQPETHLLPYLGIPTTFEQFLHAPWTLLTYMFTQFDPMHLLFNMLWLYWFGKFFLKQFSEKKLISIYLLGGISGALFNLAIHTAFPHLTADHYYTWTIGASASIMAIIFSVCTYTPNHRVHILFIGPVKLIHLALFTIIIELINLPSTNLGGHISHLGGAALGALYTYGLRHNKDLTTPVTRWIERLNKHLHKTKPTAKNKQKDQINHILQKLSQSGYNSLSKEEKEILFKQK